jgi:molecular chaperone GrpE
MMQHKKNRESRIANSEKESEKKETALSESIAEKEVTEINWETKAEEYLDDLKRCQADFENYKKRQASQQKEIGAYLIEKLVMDIVPVMDNFRMATEHIPETERSSPWVTGIQYIEKQLEKVLSENGVITIEVKIGDIFDPKIHEALEMQNENIPASPAGRKMKNDEEKIEEKIDELQQGHIVAKVIQNGFKIGERVIRPAKVIIK